MIIFAYMTLLIFIISPVSGALQEKNVIQKYYLSQHSKDVSFKTSRESKNQVILNTQIDNAIITKEIFAKKPNEIFSLHQGVLRIDCSPMYAQKATVKVTNLSSFLGMHQDNTNQVRELYLYNISIYPVTRT